MLSPACKLLKNDVAVLGGLALVSIFALAAALIGQFAFDLKPCSLCLYQRVPFMAGIVLGVTGLILKKHEKLTAPLLALLALTFLTNAGIAAYHSGVEWGWWQSVVEGCAVPPIGNESTDEWFKKIMSNPSVPCTDVQWRDPVIGLTMANYNVLLCLGLFAVSVLALMLRQCPSGSGRQKQP